MVPTVPAPASNVIDFRAARARRYEEDGLEPEPIEVGPRYETPLEVGPRYETPLEVSQRICDEYRASLSAEERARLDALAAPRLLSPIAESAAIAAKDVPLPDPPPTGRLTGNAAQAAVESLPGLIKSRHFSTMLLAWSLNPEQQGMLPNANLTAGVLVELCRRMDALEAKAAQSPRKPRKNAKRAPTPAA